MELDGRTKVGALLEAHPDLEEALIGFVPAFARLRNPLVRASVARFATLTQAARVGGVALPDLLAFLRARLAPEATVPGTAPDAGCGAPSPGGTAPEGSCLSTVPPAWYDPARVGESIDGGALLAAGVHPLGAVRSALERQPPGGVVTVRTSFEPAPLVDRFRKDGLEVACLREGAYFVTAIRKPP